jgi:hypothetical protein
VGAAFPLVGPSYPFVAVRMVLAFAFGSRPRDARWMTVRVIGVLVASIVCAVAQARRTVGLRRRVGRKLALGSRHDGALPAHRAPHRRATRDGMTATTFVKRSPMPAPADALFAWHERGRARAPDAPGRRWPYCRQAASGNGGRVVLGLPVRPFIFVGWRFTGTTSQAASSATSR